MKNLSESCYNPFFSHIYIEKSVWNHPRTKRILSYFPDAKRIAIDHYKDVFGRKKQSYALQNCAKNLILAEKTGNLVYEGAPVCQSFGNEYFYYTSCMMNCIFDCEYCYLKGMYPSGNMVVFVNLEDIFSCVEDILKIHPVYLCISYDTDILALEAVTGYAAEWMAFAKKHEHLKIEIRTKSANRAFWETVQPGNHVIYAFTLSPQKIIDSYEHHTPSLLQRLDCAAAALDAGAAVRLCFDPMIYCKDWRTHYDDMLQQVSGRMDLNRLEDASVGTFRISQDYLKRMRKNEPYSAVAQFPYQNDGGVYHYPKELTGQMEQYLVDALAKKMPREKIFLWRAAH